MAPGKDIRRRKDFFYAEAAAGMYDLTIGMVVPQYAIMKEFSLYLLRSISLPSGSVVLDVGSGTGSGSLAILSAFPDVHVISIDLCRPIQECHRRKLLELDTPALRLRERSTLICADVMEYSSGKKLLADLSPGMPFAAVVTTLAIHHLVHLEKRRFYRMAFDMLAPSGFFLNADLFSYADKRMSQSTLDFDLDWMRREFRSRSVLKGSGQKLELLLDSWIQHYNTANHLEPLEDGLRSEGQLSMLRKAGFQRVSVPYRYSLSGIVSAEKV